MCVLLDWVLVGYARSLEVTFHHAGSPTARFQVREYTGESLLHAAARSTEEVAPQLIKLLVQSGASFD